MSLVPVPSEEQPSEARCANCNAPLVSDQRYCLSCGKPVSPVRLAFLDALAPAPPAPPAGTLAAAAWSPAGYELTPSGYVPIQEQGASGWVRRNTGLIALAAVLVLCLLTGLLIGHWVSQSKTPANQTVKIEGLAGLGAVGAGGSSAAASTTPSGESATPAASKASASENKKDEEVGKHETAKEKAPPPAPKQVSRQTVNKLTQSHGKKHQEEINALGAEPIETG